MISLESLRLYPFFGALSDEDLKKVAMTTDSVEWKEGETIFGVHEDAAFIYFLENGEITLHYKEVDESATDNGREFVINDISAREPFGLSALIEPYIYTATAIAVCDSKGIVVDAKKLLAAIEEDQVLGFTLMQRVASSTSERLGQVRGGLGSARS